MLEHLVGQRRIISLYDADYGLPERLSANDWQQAEKIVKLLEPIQRVFKTTKEVMLESLKSRFKYVYNDDCFVIATLLDPRFKARKQ